MRPRRFLRKADAMFSNSISVTTDLAARLGMNGLRHLQGVRICSKPVTASQNQSG